MQLFRENSVIHFKGKEYQIRTSTNGRVNKIICSLFRNGDFINSKEFECNETQEKKLLSQIKKIHDERKADIQLLFNLSKKLGESGKVELLNMLGLILQGNNLTDEAMSEFAKANRIDPSHTLTYLNIGKALISQKKYKLAIQDFKIAIKISSDYPDLYNHLGIAYLETESCKNAIQQFNKAIELSPYYAEAYFNRGLTYILNEINKEDFNLSRNYQDEVKKSFEKAILLNPSYQNKNYGAGFKLLHENKMKKALVELKFAREKGTPSSYLHEKYCYYLKLLYYEEEMNYEMIGNYIKFLQTLINKYPGHADIYNDLGLAFCIFKNFINEQAIKYFRNALNINPNFQDAKRNLKLCNYEKIGLENLLKAITFKGYIERNTTNEIKNITPPDKEMLDIIK